ncbi:O-antigen ligase family protein [Lachnospiraceae bacterium 54-53]
MLVNTNGNTGKASGNRKLLSIILGIYVLVIGAGFPLAVRNKYFDILVFKYYYFCFSTILMLILSAGYFLCFETGETLHSIRHFSFKCFIHHFTIADCFVLIYYFIAVISTVTSDYLYESFWGNEGRFTGLFLISWYVVSYFCVSRFWKYKSWYIDLILIGGILVCLFGITDYFNLDIFKFKVAMIAEQRPIFTSTIGNINTYTAYVGMITAIATVLFAMEKRIKHMIFYYISMIISFFAIIMGVSDNAYLSLGALFGFLPLYIFKNKSGVRKYLIVLASFASVIQCIDWINSFLSDKVLGIDSVFNIVIQFSGLHFLVGALWAIVIIWYLIDYKRKTMQKEYGNLFRGIWLGIIVLILLILLFVIYDCNVAGNSERYGSLSSYFLFNDDWGTHRGYIWRNALECFFELPNWKKIIGFGPETFGILIMEKTANNPYNELFDSAHNEYLHTLVTVGIAGLTAYLFFLSAFIKNCFSNKKNNPYIIAVAFSVICYSIQAFVNLNLPIVTPVMWLLLGIGSARSVKLN